MSYIDASNCSFVTQTVIGDTLICAVILIALVKLRFTFPDSMKGFLFYIQVKPNVLSGVASADLYFLHFFHRLSITQQNTFQPRSGPSDNM